MIFKKMISGVTRSRGKCSTELDSRSPKAKEQSEMSMRPIHRFVGRVVPRAILIHLRALMTHQYRHSRLSHGPFLPFLTQSTPIS